MSLRSLRLLCALFAACPLLRASDHADPISLNPMAAARPQEPGITDLHAFVDNEENPQALVVSLCVRRSLMPDQPFDVEPYTYRILMDLQAALRYDDPGDLARYGGTIVRPRDIFPGVTLEFRLNNDATIRTWRLDGLLHADRPVVNGPFRQGTINIRSGVFDDPFIFPPFFRTNVIGIVASIPLTSFPANQREWLLWGTTSKGDRQVDHVGRSQRTQLPRFDYLNTLPPREHVAAINRVHEHPTLMEDILRTFISPLFARRAYDAAPDVMIYDRRKPARFPNGRRYEDDVAAIIAQTGDTQLFEVSYSNTTEYPRVTRNDKEFKAEFPYLADPWTAEEVARSPVTRAAGPALTSASRWKLGLLAAGAVVALILTHGLAWWLGRRKSLRAAGSVSASPDSDPPPDVS